MKLKTLPTVSTVIIFRSIKSAHEDSDGFIAPNSIQRYSSGRQKVLKSFDLIDHYHIWNRLDVFVELVVVLVAVLGFGFNDVTILTALTAFRIMVRFKKVKVVLAALLRAIPGLFNTFLFCILFWFVLSILGVNWFNHFNGLYRRKYYLMYNLNMEQCESYQGLISWISVFNFHNVFQVLHMIVVVLYSFFSLNLIASVVVDNFKTIKTEKDGNAFQTKEQSLWVNNQRLRISLDPIFDAPKKWFSKLSFKIVQHYLFDPFIMTYIILNALSMDSEAILTIAA